MRDGGRRREEGRDDGSAYCVPQVVYVPDGEEEVDSPISALAISRVIPRKSAPPFLNYSSPTPERDVPPKDKSLPTNQMKASKKKLELTRSQELYPKAILEVKN